MDTVDAIKQIVRDYLDNENLSDVMYGTYTGNGLQIDGKPHAVPLDMVDIPLHLRKIKGKLSCELTDGFEVKDSAGTPIDIKSIKLEKVEVELEYELAIGARVAVVQKRGANLYSIIDEVDR